MEKLNKFQKIINKIYYLLFVENFKGKLKFNFPLNYGRIELIDYLIKKNKYTDYLEIGCDRNQSFSNIKIKKKVGVDPVEGGTHQMTSDHFFSINKDNFDIIFIDGLHEYSQVMKDIKNSLTLSLNFASLIPSQFVGEIRQTFLFNKLPKISTRFGCALLGPIMKIL